MGEMEDQAEFYYEKLKVSVNPGQVLLEFFREILSREAGRSEIIMLNRLIKLFGRFTVFFAVMDLSKYTDTLTDNLYPLLYTICKGRFEKIHSDSYTPSSESLDKVVKNIEKEADRVRKQVAKMKIPTSESL